MVGNIIGLLLSWLILWLSERKNILVLGFTPVYKRAFQFLLGFLLSGLLCASLQLLEAWFTNSSWYLNSKITFSKIVGYLLWNFNSVVFEELLFRGALLYIAIKRLGAKKGVFLSAICFGIYHWFSFGVFGSVVPMIFVFIITGLMGFAWASAFRKTGSMALPIGLHLGWNFVFNAIFSKGFVATPVLLLERSSSYGPLEGPLSIVNSLLQNVLPSILTLLLLKFFSTKPVITHHQ
jgi:uncharacterized protein